MNEKNKSDALENRQVAAGVPHAHPPHHAPGAALRVSADAAMRQRREQLLGETSPLGGSEGLLPLNSRALLASGGFLTLLGLKNWRSFIGLGIAGLGGGLLYSGLKNNGVFDPDFKRRALNTQLGEAQQLKASVLVERPVDEVFEAWLECSNLALCMEGIDKVERLSPALWRFKASLPNNKFFVEWSAEIVESIDNEAIVWRTLPGSDIHHEGIVEFHALPDGLSTEVHLKVVYRPPAGKIGSALASAAERLSEQMLRREMERFKYFMEPQVAPALEESIERSLTDGLPVPDRATSERPTLRS